MKYIIPITLTLLLVFIAGTAMAGEYNDRYRHYGSQGKRVEHSYNAKGDRIERHFDRKAAHAAERGDYRLARHFRAKGDRIDRHFDSKGKGLHTRYDHRRYDHRRYDHRRYDHRRYDHRRYDHRRHDHRHGIEQLSFVIQQPGFLFGWGWSR